MRKQFRASFIFMSEKVEKRKVRGRSNMAREWWVRTGNGNEGRSNRRAESSTKRVACIRKDSTCLRPWMSPEGRAVGLMTNLPDGLCSTAGKKRAVNIVCLLRDTLDESRVCRTKSERLPDRGPDSERTAFVL